MSKRYEHLTIGTPHYTLADGQTVSPEEAERLRKIMAKHMEESMRELGTELGGAQTNTVGAPSSSLTPELILKACRMLKNIQFRAPGVDLYPHTLSATDCFFVKPPPLALAGLPRERREREMVLVPKARLLEVYEQMLEAGVDVRLEPRYGAPPPPAGETRET